MPTDGSGGPVEHSTTTPAPSIQALLQEIKSLFACVDDFEDYNSIVCSFLGGKFGPQQLQQALDRLLVASPSLGPAHNKLIFALLQMCEDSEQRSLGQIKKEMGDLANIHPVASPPSTMLRLRIPSSTETLNPADVHNRFLTLEDKRELYETRLKAKQLQSKEDQQQKLQQQQRLAKAPRVPLDLGSLQYYNYPLSLDLLKTLPSMDYLKKRLAVQASSNGLSLFDDEYLVAPELSYSNTISRTGSLEYFLSAWSRGLNKSALAHNAGPIIDKILEKPAVSPVPDVDTSASASKKRRVT
jgi:hypothetical protein